MMKGRQGQKSAEKAWPLQWGHVQSATLALFFFSGASALVYEVVWQRMLNLVFGNTSFATATIVASLMGGLALGSFLFGRIADSHSRPLRLFAFLEVGIAIFAVLLPLILTGISAVYTSFQQQVSATYYLSSLVKFGLCFLVLLIPGALMGGTLPVVGELLVRDAEKLGRGVGSLYGINTLGGVAGAFAAGFLLIDWLGVRETTYAAIAVSLLTATAALLIDRFFASGTIMEPDAGQGGAVGRDGLGYPRHIANTVLAVYALSGFCALAYEVLWTRVLVILLGNTAYVFTTMLTTFLLGLALGSLVFNKVVDRGKHLLLFLALVEALIGLSAILPVWQFSGFRDFVLDRYAESRGSWPALVGTRYMASLIIMFLPTLLMGVAFPLVNKIFITNLGRAGRGIGSVYSLNTLGNVLGSFAAGFILIPVVGITRSIMLVASLNLVLGVVVLLSGSGYLVKNRLGWTASVAVTAVAIIAATALSPSIRLEKLYAGEVLAYYEEGTSATVAVVQAGGGRRLLIVNGHTEVPIEYESLRAFHMLGHVPLLLHENPQEVLVLAFGAGITSGAVARHPVRRIDAVEISAEVIRANQYFAEENGDVLADPRVNLIVDDARNYLSYAQGKYDVITSDATHPTVSDSWVLYTKEFYELARARLNPHGIMAQWLPLHGFAPEDYRAVVKTFHEVFPYTTVWFTNEYSILIGSMERITIDYTSLVRRLQDEKIGQDLREYRLDDPFALLSHFVMGAESVAEYTRGARTNTDNHPFVQFAESRSKTENPIAQNLSGLYEHRESVFPLLTNLGDEAGEVQAKVQRYFEAGQHLFLGHIYGSRGMIYEQINEYSKALDINPEDSNGQYFMARALAILRRLSGTQQ